VNTAAPLACNPIVEYLLRWGDTALVLSHRLSEWCGHGPVLEEDLALTNTALDLLGQARLWLAYAGELEGQGRDEDQLAYLRDVGAYRNVLLVEQPNGHYAHTLVRQFYFDAWHDLALEVLAESHDPHIAGIAGKARKEVSYHLRRSVDLIVRLGDGTAASHDRVQASVDALWMYTGELFAGDGIDACVAAERIGFDPGGLREAWLERVAEVLREATIVMPAADAWMQRGGKQGQHGEHLGYLLAELQYLQRAYPGANW
jgi:ring-1,2-phenylacetyl-CoA epoxidase subunit PaaC